MTPLPIVLLLLGVGVLIVADSRVGYTRPTLRDQALAAQERAARAAERARELAAQWSAEQDRRAKGSP